MQFLRRNGCKKNKGGCMSATTPPPFIDVIKTVLGNKEWFPCCLVSNQGTSDSFLRSILRMLCPHKRAFSFKWLMMHIIQTGNERNWGLQKRRLFGREF